MTAGRLHDESFGALDAATFYGLARLRAEVFVVEQASAFPDLDGRDLEPDARHVWWDEGGPPLAYLRVLVEPDGSVRIGRVVTAAVARSRGLADRLVRHALARTPPVDVVLDAQTQLVAWYGRYGFEVWGAQYVDGGIAHVPMRLTRRRPLDPPG